MYAEMVRWLLGLLLLGLLAFAIPLTALGCAALALGIGLFVLSDEAYRWASPRPRLRHDHRPSENISYMLRCPECSFLWEDSESLDLTAVTCPNCCALIHVHQPIR